jgi:hypothetical protein
MAAVHDERKRTMHLHEVLRTWREELLSSAVQVAIAEEAARALGGPLEAMPRDSIPGGLRRDEPDSLQVRLLPAQHKPKPPAADNDLDTLEQQLGFELPREVELLLRLHDGGHFFEPQDPELSESHIPALKLLSCSEIATAYRGMVSRIGSALEEADASPNDCFRAARRFGASPEAAESFANQLEQLAAGRRSGLELLPLMTPPGRPDDLICFAPLAGREGRMGLAYATSNFLPEHSDEYPFDGVTGWLLALLKGRGCGRLLLG